LGGGAALGGNSVAAMNVLGIIGVLWASVACGTLIGRDRS
jgi:hypothetical protein